MKRAATAVVAAFALAGCGGALGSTPTPAPPATVTVTATATVTVTAEPPKPTVRNFNGKPEDFEIGINITEKKCFGSAGCNVTFHIQPSYVGTELIPSSGSLDVTYEVLGGEDQHINTFTIRGDQAHFDADERIGAPNADAVLTAKATSVTYRP